MEEIKVLIEIKGEIEGVKLLEQADKLAIEDAIMDALKALEIEVVSVRVRF